MESSISYKVTHNTIILLSQWVIEVENRIHNAKHVFMWHFTSDFTIIAKQRLRIWSMSNMLFLHWRKELRCNLYSRYSPKILCHCYSEEKMQTTITHWRFILGLYKSHLLIPVISNRRCCQNTSCYPDHLDLSHFLFSPWMKSCFSRLKRLSLSVIHSHLTNIFVSDTVLSPEVLAETHSLFSHDFTWLSGRRQDMQKIWVMERSCVTMG